MAAAPFFVLTFSKQQAERDRNELVHAAFGSASRNAVVARLKECCEWTEAKRGSKSGVKTEIVLSLRAGDISLGAVESAASNDIRLGIGAGKGENQICQHSADAEIGAARTAASRQRSDDVLIQNVVVNGIEAHTERKFCHSNCQQRDGVVASFLCVTEFAHGYRGAAAKAEGICLLATGGRRKPNQQGQRDQC